MSTCKFSVFVESDVDGYFAFYPELQDYFTQCDNYKEMRGTDG